MAAAIASKNKNLGHVTALVKPAVKVVTVRPPG